METLQMFKALMALVFIIGLIGIVAALFKKYSEKAFGITMKKNKRLKVDEVLAIDPRRKLMTVKYDEKKYILLLGNNDVVIDSFIEKPKKK